jgi:hypothetical protein
VLAAGLIGLVLIRRCPKDVSAAPITSLANLAIGPVFGRASLIYLSIGEDVPGV